VQGIDPCWNTGEQSSDSAEQSSLGRAAFDQVGLQAGQRSPEPIERYEVAERGHLALDRNSDGCDTFLLAEAIEIGTGGADQSDTNAIGPPHTSVVGIHSSRGEGRCEYVDEV